MCFDLSLRCLVWLPVCLCYTGLITSVALWFFECIYWSQLWGSQVCVSTVFVCLPDKFSPSKSTRTVPWCWFLHPWSQVYLHNNSTVPLPKVQRLFLGVGSFIDDHSRTHTTTVQLCCQKHKDCSLVLVRSSMITVTPTVRLCSVLPKMSESARCYYLALNPFTHKKIVLI